MMPLISQPQDSIYAVNNQSLEAMNYDMIAQAIATIQQYQSCERDDEGGINNHNVVETNDNDYDNEDILQEAANFLVQKILFEQSQEQKYSTLNKNNNHSLVHELIHKYGLYNAIYEYLKECNDYDQEPCADVISIILLTVMNNNSNNLEQAAATLSKFSPQLLDELLTVLQYSLDFEKVKPTVLGIIGNIVMMSTMLKYHSPLLSCSLSTTTTTMGLNLEQEWESIIESMLCTEWNRNMMPFVLNIFHSLTNYIDRNELLKENVDLCQRIHERLADEQMDIISSMQQPGQECISTNATDHDIVLGLNHLLKQLEQLQEQEQSSNNVISSNKKPQDSTLLQQFHQIKA